MVEIRHLGNIDYEVAWKRQKEAVQQRLEGRGGDVLMICSHPPVVTLGKKGRPQDWAAWKGPVYQIERGGKATYHGPEQVILYPIVNLKERGQNVAGLLFAMEMAIVQALGHYQLKARGNPSRGISRFTGVWVGEKKVASIGLAIKKWVTYHGLALNLYHSEEAFRGISPCGLSREEMTSVESLKQGQKISREELEKYLVKYLLEGLRNLCPV